jgi:hypothetical protein
MLSQAFCFPDKEVTCLTKCRRPPLVAGSRHRRFE